MHSTWAKATTSIATAMALGFCITAYAAPPIGQTIDPEMQRWYKSLQQPNTGAGCCSLRTADPTKLGSFAIIMRFLTTADGLRCPTALFYTVKTKPAPLSPAWQPGGITISDPRLQTSLPGSCASYLDRKPEQRT